VLKAKLYQSRQRLRAFLAICLKISSVTRNYFDAAHAAKESASANYEAVQKQQSKQNLLLKRCDTRR
jgi:hypothetical protein